MDSTLRPETIRAETAEEFACEKEALDMAKLLETFRYSQASIARHMEARDRALTNFCSRLDMSLSMLQTIAQFVGRQHDQRMKHAGYLMVSELEHLASSLKIVLHTCTAPIDMGDKV